MNNIKSHSPDYSKYTIKELEEVLRDIDKTQFPERYAMAKAIHSDKMKDQVIEPSNYDSQAIHPHSKPKWSEQTLISRVVTSILFILLLMAVPAMFSEHMVAKSWTKKTTLVNWLIALTLATMWFICLLTSPDYTRRLKSSWRGVLGILMMPILLPIFGWIFVDKSLPLALHTVTAKQEVQYIMEYRKRSSSTKYCRQKLQILETDELENTHLCLTSRQFDRLDKRGTINVIGNQSQFGLVVEGYRPL